MDLLFEVLGVSPGIVALRERAERLLSGRLERHRLPAVLIQGETGSGKGLLAHSLHRASARGRGPFIDVNCAAIPETMLEAELFGFERGAFTDAKQPKPGLFQAANQGTIFLDEISLLSPLLQAKLLKVVEDKTVRRLGSTRSEPADVWVISATNDDLPAALRERRFREDLYHRLAVITLTLPPLRERGGDIMLLAERFLARATADYGLSPMQLGADARAALTAYGWPGNVRELINVIERAALLTDASTLHAADLGLPVAYRAREVTVPAAAPDGGEAGPDLPRRRLAQALAETGWNISRTAALLGITRNTVKTRMRRFGLREAAAAAAVTPPPEPTKASAVSARADAQTGPARAPRWELRRLTFVRVCVLGVVWGDADSRASRQLAVAADRLGGFGGRIEGAGPTLLLGVFGLDAREEPAVFAAHSALVIRNAARAIWPDTSPMPVCIGLHTAEVLVRVGMGVPMLDADGSRREWACLEASMKGGGPGDILATRMAARLLRRRFVITPDPIEPALYRVDRVWRVAPASRSSHESFVGRQEELGLLESRLTVATQGRGQVVGIVGEPGIGKSRLVLELASGSRAQAVRCLEGRCLPWESQTPFYPILQLLRAACDVDDADAGSVVETKVHRVLGDIGVGAEGVAEISYLLGARPDPPEAPGPVLTRRLFRAVQRILLGLAARQPLLVIVEDLHWVDPTSEACLATLVEASTGAAVLLVATFRPEYRPGWSDTGGVLRITLPPMSASDSLAIVRRMLESVSWSAAVEHNIQARGEGNPLFLEELSLAALERGDGSMPERIPATVEDTIAGRLAVLPPRLRRLLAVASVIGRDVPLRLLRMVADLDDETLRMAIAQLLRADFLYESACGRPDPSYVFKHALVQETAYAALPTAERTSLHVRVLDALEGLDPDRLVDRVERLAHHAVCGEDHARAVRYLLQAGRKAAARSALTEAINHLGLGRVILVKLPEGPARDLQELALQIAIGLAFGATRGWAAPETDQAFARARAISRESGNVSQLGPILVGRWVSTLLRAQYHEARGLAEELSALAAGDPDPLIGTVAHRALGMTAIFCGDFVAARRHLERGLALYRPGVDHARAVHDYGGAPHVSCLAFLGRALWALGYPDQALARAVQAVTEAEASGGALSIATALGVLTSVWQLRGDAAATREASERVLAHAAEWNTTYWAAQATVLQRWAEASMAPAAGLRDHASLYRRSVEHYQLVTGTTLGLTWFLTLAAELHGRSGEALAGLRVIGDALSLADKTGEQYHVAEMHRVRGELLLVHGGEEFAPAAEDVFRHAIDVARGQQARSWELRATTSLARSLRARGRAGEAAALLGSIYECFTEGFDTVDLGAARALLDDM